LELLTLFPVILFGPVIEPNSTTDGIILDTPENYYTRNEVAKVPWLVTATEYEFEYFLQGQSQVTLKPKFTQNVFS